VLRVDRKARQLQASGNDLLQKAERLTTPFTTQNRSKLGFGVAGEGSMRKTTSTIRDVRDLQGSGGDARRTSYTLTPGSADF
jgi:hypothetical protein